MRADIGERLKHKAPHVQARVGNGDRTGADDQVVAIKNVEVQHARGVFPVCAGASELLLEILQHNQKIVRLARSLDLNNRIQECRRAGGATDG